VGAGVGRIALDSFDDIERVAVAAAAAGRRQAVVLRLTPGVEAHTHSYIQTGQEDSKFGLSIELGLAMEGVKRAAAQPSLDLVGIHAHIGSNIFSYDPFGKTVEILFGFLADVQGGLGIALTEVDLGGGFGIPYVAGDYPLRLDLLSSLVAQTAEREAIRHGIAVPSLSFEPGRFLVGNAGVTLYQAHYTALLANKARHEPSRMVTVAGMHCESGDILVHDAMLPATIERGDVLVTPATGAYGHSMASNYNRQPRPAVVLVHEGSARVVVRRETFDDLIRLELPPEVPGP
jgi:diaminopimelate decarboxylase